jgi:thymidylate synthase ThyX
MFQPTAKVLADSVNDEGYRLTTMEIKLPLFILPQLLTHRMFSGNGMSARAVPYKRYAQMVVSDDVSPVEWGANESGMQAYELMSEEDAAQAQVYWDAARQHMLYYTQKIADLGAHKQFVNRLLIPFATCTRVISATTYDNFFRLRLEHDVQPEMQELAKAMHDAYVGSEPMQLDYGQWHLPYIKGTTAEKLKLPQRIRVSVARCARVSYKAYDGRDSVEKDEQLFSKLVNSKPPHLSPLEHVATPVEYIPGQDTGNFRGWLQMRKLLERDRGNLSNYTTEGN